MEYNRTVRLNVVVTPDDRGLCIASTATRPALGRATRLRKGSLRQCTRVCRDMSSRKLKALVEPTAKQYRYFFENSDHIFRTKDVE